MSANKKTSALRWFLIGMLVVAVALGAVILTVRPCIFSDPKTTILLVRHAERGTTPGDDFVHPDGSRGPMLTDPAGLARAQELAHVAGEPGVTAIYHTQYIRTRQTIEPLDNIVSGNTTRMFEADRVDDLVKDVLDNHRGEVVVIASHSNKVPEIIARLGGPQMPEIQSGDFDNLFVITISCKNPPKVVRLKYGQPT